MSGGVKIHADDAAVSVQCKRRVDVCGPPELSAEIVCDVLTQSSPHCCMCGQCGVQLTTDISVCCDCTSTLLTSSPQPPLPTPAVCTGVIVVDVRSVDGDPEETESSTSSFDPLDDYTSDHVLDDYVLLNN